MCSIQTIVIPAAAERLDRLDELEHLGLGQPAPDLVEEEDARLGDERPRELEPLALEQRQLARRRVRLAEQPRLLERLDARPRWPLPLRLAAPVGGADEDVLERGQSREGARDLKGPGDAGAAVLVAGERS